MMKLGKNRSLQRNRLLVATDRMAFLNILQPNRLRAATDRLDLLSRWTFDFSWLAWFLFVALNYSSKLDLFHFFETWNTKPLDHSFLKFLVSVYLDKEIFAWLRIFIYSTFFHFSCTWLHILDKHSLIRLSNYNNP